MISNNYQLLINKLDQFIRKYYTNKLVRGALFTTALVLAAFLVISLSEYFFYFPTTVRKVLFYGFLGTSIVSFVGWILVPLLQIFKLGSVINHQQAAQIIGKHFTNVSDKLLNVLQLKNQADESTTDSSLIVASINQKIEDIKLVPFVKAVDISKNRQYLKYALPPLMLLLGLLVGAPNIIRDSSFRLFNNNREFERPAPFKFVMPNQTLEATQYEDLSINVQVEGSILPNEAFIHINNFPYKLKKISPTEFSYTFNKLMKDTPFFFEAGEVRSGDYNIKVYPKPAMLGFDVKLNYPAYTGRKNETLENTGDMVVPQGTRATWTFEAQNTESVQIRFGEEGKLINATRSDAEHYTFATGLSKDATYTVYLSNARVTRSDSMVYNVSVIPDQYPTISAEEKRDTGDNKTLYFIGDAADDYGINNVYFRYTLSSEKEANSNSKTSEANFLKIPVGGIERGRKAASYTFTWDVLPLKLNPGDRLTYFFEVWDNDGVNGSKSAKTQMFSYEMPTIKEMKDVTASNNEQMKDDMEKVIKEAKEIQKAIEDVKEKLIDKKELNSDDKSQIQNLLEKHKNLQEQIEKMQENFEKNKQQEKEYKEKTDEIQKKEEQLQKMLDEMISPEMKELMEKLQKLMEEMRKDDAMNQLENFEMNNEEMKMEMDKMMNLFKQLEYEQKAEEAIKDLNKLADEEEKLSKETEQQPQGDDMKEQQEKQKDIQDKFDQLKEDVKDLDKKGKELGKEDKKMQKETQDDQQDAKQEMEESQGDMKEGDSKSAGKKQQSASKKMRQMAKKMEEAMQKMKSEQIEMDMKAIRQLLENLVDLSMDQEDLMDEIKEADINNPQYNNLMKQQYKLKDDMQIIEDSLTALSKRVFQLESFITKELSETKRNMGDALDNLEARKLSNATINQQYVMTGTNNLALMLSEAMQQMQAQMAMSMPGNQMCQKPGSKPGGMQGLGKMQQQLNDQIAKMQQQMKDGKAGGKDGKAGKDGKGGMSKEAAQLAAKQAALRQALEKINQDQNKDGTNSLGDLKDITKDMDKTETELINKQITAEMLKRQQDILSRLLKAENADRERDWDDKRESKTAYNRTKKVPAEIAEYMKKKQSETELYKTVPPSLKPYYKDLVDRYFKSIGF